MAARAFVWVGSASILLISACGDNKVEGRATRPPSLEVPAAAHVREGEALSITALASDPDEDVLALVVAPQPANSTFDTRTGLFSWTPDFDRARAEPYLFVFSADDGSQLTQGRTQVFVDDVNRRPELVVPSSLTAEEGMALSFRIGATDPDPEDTVTILPGDLPPGAVIARNAFSWTPTFRQSGVYQVPIVAVDDHTLSQAESASEVVTITIYDANRTPVLEGATDWVVDEASTLAFTLSGSPAVLYPGDTEGDAETGQSLTYSMRRVGGSQLPPGATLVTDSLTHPAQGEFRWDVGCAAAGVYTFGLRVTDDGDPPRSDTRRVTITVRETNCRPALSPVSTMQVDEGQLLAIDLAESSSDPDGDALTDFGVAFSADGGSAIPLPPTASLDRATGAFRWTPAYTDAGSYTLTFNVHDHAAAGPANTNTAAAAVAVTVRDSARKVSVIVVGGGKVTSAPQGIDCGTTCSGAYSSGPNITLTAAAAPSWQFGYWSGDCAGTSTTTQVSTLTNKTCTAVFELPRALILTVRGTGSVTSDPPGITCGADSTCSTLFGLGRRITLSASTSNTDWWFQSWSGDCAGTNPVYAFTMTENPRCTATFAERLPRDLSVVVVGPGSVGIQPAGGTCGPGATCTTSHRAGDAITLTASPASGAVEFGFWSGSGCTGASPTLTIDPIAADMMCTAHFFSPWAATYGGSGDEWATGVAALPNRDLIAVGPTSSFGIASFAGASAAWYLRLDGNSEGGTVLTQKAHANSHPTAVVAAGVSGGDFAVAGIDWPAERAHPYASATGVNSADTGVFRSLYDWMHSSGASAIVRLYTGSFALAGMRANVGRQSLVYLVGPGGGVGGGGHFAMLKSDCDPLSVEDVTRSVADTPAKSLITAGSTTAGENTDLVVRELALAGQITMVRQRRYGGPATDEAAAILALPQGGYLVAGRTESFGAGGSDVWVLRLNQDLTVAWQKALGGPAHDQAAAAYLTRDGKFLVAGSTRSFGSGSDDVWVIKLDLDGSVLWEKAYGGAGSDKAYAVTGGARGGYLVAGETRSFGAGGADFWLLQLGNGGGIAFLPASGAAAVDTAAAVTDTSAAPTPQTISCGPFSGGYLPQATELSYASTDTNGVGEGQAP